MHKIKKGIKKKIKGKKNKGNNELFTEEEYERYKKEKEEEAKSHLEEDPEGAASDEHILDESADEPRIREDTNDAHEEPVEEATFSEKGGDWRNFFSDTDSVLKSTTVNLEHIKEASYFQVNKKHEELAAVEETVTSVSAAALSNEAPSKGWVDLDKGGIDDDSLEEDKYERYEEPFHEEEQVKEDKKKLVELKPLDLEDLPTVAAEDYADVFDTTFVDNVESGEVQLFEIPDSPTDDDLNEPDPFDTSGVDKILAVKKKEHKSKKSKAKKVPEPQKPPPKKKKNLVNLGCAVDVLTGKATETQGTVNLKKVPESKVPEVNLLADFDESSTEVTALTEEAKKDNTKNQQTEEKCVVDDILFGIEPDCDLPDIIQIPPQIQSNLEHESSDFDDKNFCTDDLTNKKSNVTLTELYPLASVGEPKESSRESHLKDLVAEFDVIDRTEEKSIPSVIVFESHAIDDNIKDEFDAEFAVLAAESIAKEKEKAIDELGQLDGDDPFDTSAVNHILCDNTCNTEEEEKDPFNVEFANQVVGNTTNSAKTVPPRPALPKNSKNFSEVDPFDTSAAAEFLTAAVDHFDSVEPDISLPETLQPVTSVDLSKSDSFDPFDTSAADKFGITELKALEGELLKNINKNDDFDLDFNPREGEPEVPLSQSEQPSCLLSEGGEESDIQPTLTPQAVDTEVDDFDPFDTSIADKVQIQSLEVLLTKEENHSHLKAEVKNKNPPQRPVNPACILSLLNNSETSTTQISSISKHALAEDFDPFDTTIADQFTEDNKEPSVERIEETQTLKLNFKPLRPASPVCLLGATPEDENPTLKPISKGIDIVGKSEEEELDPFDTSIADQFGKTELRALESVLLAKTPVDVDDDFDPRAYEPTDTLQNIESSEPLPKSAPPLCLLTGTSPELEQVLQPLSPTEVKCTASADIDPFDTSIANKFGKVEIQNLENELLSGIKFEENISSNIEEKQTNQLSEPVASVQCVFDTSPTDTNIPLQPTFQQSAIVSAEEEVDPFDTSIAEQFGKTELKVLEETLLTKENSIPASIVPPGYSAVKEQVINTLEVREADILFDISPSADSLPVLQPLQAVPLKAPSPDYDPFDTSIADKFGSTELKALESQLLVDSGTKRGLSDDEFDPREEETKKKSPSEVSNQNILDFHIDFPEQTLAVLEASAVISISEDDIDPFDTSIADGVGGPSKIELSLLDKELLG